jgi:hypothetical protein
MSTVIGCGTHFYGHTDKREDQSYITTNWVTVFYVPIVPLQSYRVVRQDSTFSNQGYVISSSTRYGVLGSGGLSVFQVVSVYLSMAASCAWAAMFIALAAKVNIDDSVFLQVSLTSTLLVAPVLSFLYARRAGRNPLWWAAGGLLLSACVPIVLTTVVPAKPRGN